MKAPKYEDLNCCTCKESYMKKHNPKFWNYINSHYANINKWSEKLYWYYSKLTEYPKCPMCGKVPEFQSFNRGYRTFCSHKCLNNYQKIKDKKEKTCLEKYGVKNAMQNKEIARKRKLRKKRKEVIPIKNYDITYIYYNDKQIKAPLKSYFIPGRSAETSLRCHFPEFLEYLNNTYPKDLSVKEKLYWYYNGLTDYPRCPTCGKPTNYININEGYRDYCCYKCMNGSSAKVEKTKQTCLAKFGCIAPAQSEEIKQKARQTCLERYGVENSTQSEEIKQKIRSTIIERYGGVGNASPEILEKYKKSNIEKYGVENILCDPGYKEKIKQTWIDKCGVDHPSKNKDIINKIIDSRRKTEINKHDYLIGYTENGEWICKCPHPECNKCSEKFYIIPVNRFTDRKYDHTEPCTRLLPIGKDNTKNTSIELFVQRLLDKYNIEYIANDRSIIKPKELDIYIPSKNLAIECNGIFSHSDRYKDPDYHLNKSLLCKSHGIRLIHIWEDWIRNKPDIVESLLLSKIGIKQGLTTVYARQTQIELCTNRKEYLQFMGRNHIQGRSGFQEAYGLRCNGELISIMTFGHKRGCVGNYKKSSNKNEWELLRFCSKIGYHIPGAASKLLKHFIKDFNPQLIYSYASNDISEGNVYEKLGFVSTGKTNQSYWYIDIETGKRYHRSAFTKNSIVKRGWKEVNDSSWTERQVMEQMGYVRLNDAGQTRWDLDIKNFRSTC